MKKLSFIIAAVLLAVSALPASAQTVTADRMGMHSEELCVYVGENNFLYAVGESEPLLEESVKTLEYASDTVIVFTVAEETHEDFDREGVMVALDLSTDPYEQTDIAGNITAALWAACDGVLYYVTHDAPTMLKSYDPMRGILADVCNAGEPIAGLRLSVNGLLVSGESWEKHYEPVLRALVDPVFSAPASTIIAGGKFDVLLDAEGVMSLRADDSAEPKQLAQSVICAAVEHDIIYYIETSDPASPHLMAYLTYADWAADMYAFDEPIRPGMALDVDGFVFAMGESGAVYRYMIQSGACDVILWIDISDVFAPVMRAFDGLLLVYESGSEGEIFLAAAETDTRALLDAGEADGIAPPEEIPGDGAGPEGDEEGAQIANGMAASEGGFVTLALDLRASGANGAATPLSAASNEEFKTLSLGSRGEAVVRLQKKLKALGYLSAAADGVYGKSTQTAVTYLQGDMGYTETGSAGPKFQYAIYYGHPPMYERCKPLSKDDEGIRVKEMQARLRTLNYMAVNAGGHYQDNTVAAVKRFQKQMGYKQANRITAAQLKKLFSKSCPQCTEYFTLQKGDNAPVVKWLNQRLKKLGYLSGSAGSAYDKYTVKAVELFQANNGLLATGKCTGNLQRMIYDRHAKPYTPNPTPTPKPAPAPSGQVVTDKQVKVVRNFLNQRFGKDWNNKKAVGKLQTRLIELEHLSEGEKSHIYDAKTKAAVREYQRVDLGRSSPSGIADKETLRSLFP